MYTNLIKGNDHSANYTTDAINTAGGLESSGVATASSQHSLQSNALPTSVQNKPQRNTASVPSSQVSLYHDQ